MIFITVTLRLCHGLCEVYWLPLVLYSCSYAVNQMGTNTHRIETNTLHRETVTKS